MKKGTTISFLNFKGGVGKTLTTCSVGSALARRGFKTLLVDIDAQANLTEYLGVVAGDNTRTIFEAILEQKDIPIIEETIFLHFIPSSVRLAAIEQKLAGDTGRSMRLSKLLSQVRDKYDFILIDCPPAFGVGSTSALVASDFAVIPMEPTAFPLSGMEKMKAFAERAMKNNKHLSLLGIVFTRYRATRCQKETIAEVTAAYPTLPFLTRIRENTTLAESTGAHWDIFEYDPKSNGAKDYQALTEEILARMNTIQDNDIKHLKDKQ